MTNQNDLRKVANIDAHSVRYLVTMLDQPNVLTLVQNNRSNQSKFKYEIIYLNSTAILLCFHTLFYFFRESAPPAAKKGKHRIRRTVQPQDFEELVHIENDPVLDDVVQPDAVLDEIGRASCRERV